MFNKLTYTRRRSALVAGMKARGASGLVLFVGNVEAPAQYRDNCYKYRQDSNWIYFFGIDEPRFAATIDLDNGDETVYADDFTMDDIIWMGPTPSVASQAAEVGVEHTAAYSALDEVVAKAKAQGRSIHFLPASRYYQAMKLASLTGLAPEDTFSKGKAGCPAASLPMVESVIALRLIKEEQEIALIDEACTLGQKMHSIARDNIRLGIKEQEIVGAMEGFAIAKGWGVSFATILTQHGEIFHCHSHDALVEDGRLMVIDAGLESNDHYASDFTRTYPTGGKYTSKQRDIYQIVYECNELAFELSRPGTSYRDVHLAMARKMLEGLKSLELVRGDVDEMLAQGVAGLFMPHGLGHNMGIDVHDMEDLGENLVGYKNQTRSSQLGLGSLRMARKLVPGNVISDEPGIYFIPALWDFFKKNKLDKGFVNFDKLEAYKDFGGIRLEDDLLITSEGSRFLGHNRLPIKAEDVEKDMAS